MMTVGALRYFNEAGYILGETMSLIGFDEVELLEWLGMSVSVVNRPMREMGRRAFQLLLAKEADREMSRDIQQLKLPVALILRGSEKTHA